MNYERLKERILAEIKIAEEQNDAKRLAFMTLALAAVEKLIKEKANDQERKS